MLVIWFFAWTVVVGLVADILQLQCVAFTQHTIYHAVAPIEELSLGPTPLHVNLQLRFHSFEGRFCFRVCLVEP